VDLSEKPETVAVLFSSLAEIWMLAGGEVDVTVGETVERGFASADAILVDGGAGKSIDTERLLAAAPDLVIGSADIPAQVEACRQMARAGIPTALFRLDTLEDYLFVLKLCTELTGVPDAYETYGLAVEKEAQQVLASVKEWEGEPKTILFVRSGSTDSSTKAKRAPENFVCVMLQQLGVHNIPDDAPIVLDGLSLEHVMARDPDFIFFATMGDEAAAKAHIENLLAQEGWRELTAVREGNWVFLPRDLFHFKPNARWAQAYGYLAKLLYPELN
jgi:iron complex transport system substrate-binding protein